MNRPQLRPVLGAAAGLMLGAGGALAAAEPTAAPAPKPKPAWVEKIATGSKKLAFWDKEKQPAEPAAPPAAAPPPPAAKKQKPGAARPAAVPAEGTPAAPPAARRRGAAAQNSEAAGPPVPAEPAAEKKSIFTKLPALPFVKKRGEGPSPEVTPPPPPAPAEATKKSPTPKKSGVPAKPAGDAAAAPAVPAEAEPLGEKKPGIFDLGRFLPGARKNDAEASSEAPAAVADRKAKTRTEAAVAGTTAGKPASGKPVAGKPGAKPDAVEPEASEVAKPSLWERMTAKITPKSRPEEKPATTPVPRGLAPMAPDVVDASTFVITKDDSPFYTFGPQQATPPDAYLPTGTVVTLAQKNWGWATVRLGDGRTGIVDRSALRPAVLADLIPAGRPGDALMASLTPGQTGRKSSANFVLPAAEMPDLPTGGDAAVAGNPLLLPFSPEDVTDPSQLPPLPEIPPLPEPSDSSPKDEPPVQPAAPEPAAPEPAAPATADPSPTAPSSPEPSSPPETPPSAPAPAEPAPAPESGN